MNLLNLKMDDGFKRKVTPERWFCVKNIMYCVITHVDDDKNYYGFRGSKKAVKPDEVFKLITKPQENADEHRILETAFVPFKIRKHQLNNLGVLTDITKIPQSIIDVVPSNHEFERLRYDNVVEWGDGGRGCLVFPVWRQQHLLSDTNRLLLMGAISRLDQSDEQSNIVTDLINPDMYPHRIPWRADQDKVRLDVHLREWRMANPNTTFKPEDEKKEDGRHFDSYPFQNSVQDCLDRIKTKAEGKDPEDEYETQLLDLPPGILFREHYMWVPSIVTISKTGQARYTSDINGLERTPKTNDLYIGFERVLTKMVPMFQQLKIVPRNQETTLQVICKAQRYTLEPGMTYKGHWHLEGRPENIIGVGVYYVDVGDIKGGAVKFRSPGTIPAPHYYDQRNDGDEKDVNPNITVAADTNSCIVFSNAMPHRVRLMKNQTDKTQTRTFINFFIVNPKMPIVGALPTFFTGDQYASMMRQYVAETLGRTLPKDVVSIILGYCRSWIWANKAEALEFRAKARNAMQATRKETGPGFYHIMYGNCGIQGFINDDMSVTCIKMQEEVDSEGGVVHTSSHESGMSDDNGDCKKKLGDYERDHNKDWKF